MKTPARAARSGAPTSAPRSATAWTRSSAARTARSASSSFGDRGAPHGHHRVADELLHRPAVALDQTAAGLEVAGEELADVLGVAGLGERGEADQVGKENRDESPLGGRPRVCGLGRGRRRSHRGFLSCQRRAALRAERHRGVVRRTARSAGPTEFCAATAAETGGGRILSGAVRADHQRSMSGRPRGFRVVGLAGRGVFAALASDSKAQPLSRGRIRGEARRTKLRPTLLPILASATSGPVGKPDRSIRAAPPRSLPQEGVVPSPGRGIRGPGRRSHPANETTCPHVQALGYCPHSPVEGGGRTSNKEREREGKVIQVCSLTRRPLVHSRDRRVRRRTTRVTGRGGRQAPPRQKWRGGGGRDARLRRRGRPGRARRRARFGR